jgi:hypothetical protein
MKTQKSTILISLAVGFILAMVFLSGSILITTDRSYYNIFGIESMPLNTNDTSINAPGWKYEGKTIMNPPYRGLPLSIYSDCKIYGAGMIHFEGRCFGRAHDALGKTLFFAMLDVLFWSAVVYAVMWIIRKTRKQPDQQK